jgi:superfamily I DNA/RNA helicase
VDEFQDSNPAQMKIVEALLKRSKKEVKLLMVGDFDQNIYTWRGASIQYIDQFVRARSPKIVNLANSYRLGKSLRDLSQKLITSFPPYEFFRRRFYKDYQLHAKGKHDEQAEVRIFE